MSPPCAAPSFPGAATCGQNVHRSACDKIAKRIVEVAQSVGDPFRDGGESERRKQEREEQEHTAAERLPRDEQGGA